MSISVAGKRYARALFQLAREADAVARVQGDLRDFKDCWQSSRELRSVFANPSVQQQSRRAVLRELAQTMQLHDRLRDLLLLLSDRRRMPQLPEIAEAFDAMVEQTSGKLHAEVITASELPDGYFAELEHVLHSITGKQVVIAHTVDSSLIGGVTTRIGDQVFDGSLKSRLSELTHELLS